MSQIIAELNIWWETERIVVKPYAAMGGLHAARCSLRHRRATPPGGLGASTRHDVDLSHAVFHHGWWTLSGTRGPAPR